MASPVNKAEKLMEKFGVIRDVSPDVYDEIAKIVFSEKIEWEDSANGGFACKATVKNKPWKLRINDFPEEPMYTLFIENKAVITFDDRPDNWSIKGE